MAHIMKATALTTFAAATLFALSNGAATAQDRGREGGIGDGAIRDFIREEFQGERGGALGERLRDRLEQRSDRRGELREMMRDRIMDAIEDNPELRDRLRERLRDRIGSRLRERIAERREADEGRCFFVTRSLRDEDGDLLLIIRRRICRD